MKRILFMHQVSSIGGASYCMLAILKGLDRTKFEPVVLLRNNGSLADEIKTLNIDVAFLPEMPTVPYNKSLLDFRTIMTYKKISEAQKHFLACLNRFKPDIVYINNMMLYPYLKTAKQHGCRTIMHVREHWPLNEHVCQLNRARRYTNQYADEIIAINQYSADIFPECKNRTTIVHDWFDMTNRFEPLPFKEIFGKDADKLKVFLFTGGLGRIKGTREVVKIFNEKIKGSEYRLLIMGPGLDYSLDENKGKLKRLLMLTGWKPYGYQVMEMIKQDERIFCKQPTYNLVDIYRQAYCTISYFTIPHANLALAEAASLGTIGIAPLTEESVEYTDNGKGAVLFKINDENDFLEKIYSVIENYEEVRKRVSRHSDNIKEMFSPELNIERLNSVCNRVAQMCDQDVDSI